MFIFFIKKNFCDVWDNLFHTMIVNIFITLASALAFFLVAITGGLPGGESAKNLVSLLALVFACCLVCTLIIAEGENALKIASFEGPKIGKFFKNILPSLKDGVFLGLYVALVLCIALVSIPYYFHVWVPADGSRGSMLGLLMMSLVFWFVFITVFSLQYFVPIRSIMHNNFTKCLKKCYILFFDNLCFTLGMGLMNLVNILVMIFTVGILNGSATITITCTEGLRLRLYKYDWYEVNPDLTPKERRDVPWQDLIANDKKILGPRHWKSFIFPWKE